MWLTISETFRLSGKKLSRTHSDIHESVLVLDFDEFTLREDKKKNIYSAILQNRTEKR